MENNNSHFSKNIGAKDYENINNGIKNIFTPFSAFAFLFLGLLACFCSGMIEGSKFTLHYYGEALKRRGLNEEIDDFDVEKNDIY